MNTPICDFAVRYKDLRPARFHMPGHKGRGPLGCEALDLTEIPGADSLYEAAGIIAGSEENASALFGCPTYYSTEGSSHCIRAMLLLASQASGIRHQASGDGGKAFPLGGRCPSAHTGADEGRADPGFRVLAARNVHSAFLSAAALLDLDVVWLPCTDGSYLSAPVTPEALGQALAETGAAAVYLTCPDYLGFLPDLAPLAAVCHARGALLLVDNAHGAYLRFLTPSRHPMDLGADLCCDSAHKTLPVLTGGAYLHVSDRLVGAHSVRPPAADAQIIRDALAVFGSTSPSYLILQSLDLANPYLETLPERLAAFLPEIEAMKARLTAAGWRCSGDEPLKLTLELGPAEPGAAGPPSGTELAAALEQEGVFCEFADPEHVVFLLSPQNTAEELFRLERALTAFPLGGKRHPTSPASRMADEGRFDAQFVPSGRTPDVPETVCSVREAMLSPAEWIPAAQSLGRVLARPGVSCPPAVPILMPGERIGEAALEAFRRYGVETCAVLRQDSPAP